MFFSAYLTKVYRIATPLHRSWLRWLRIIQLSIETRKSAGKVALVTGGNSSIGLATASTAATCWLDGFVIARPGRAFAQPEDRANENCIAARRLPRGTWRPATEKLPRKGKNQVSYALDFLLSTARVVVSGHDQQTSDAAKAEIGAGTLAVKANVSSLAEIDRRIAPVQAELGHIDMLFVNAGIFKGVPLQASAASSHFF